MRVQDISGKDVHCVKARSGQANPGFEGGPRDSAKNIKHTKKLEKAGMRGGCRVHGCLGGVQGVPGTGGSRG